MYPINLEISERECIVLGGGSVAHRKVLGLLDAGARITIISPTLCNELKSLLDQKKLRWLDQKYERGMLPRGVLFIAAADDPNVNRLAAEEAAEKNMLVNIASGGFEGKLRFENPSTLRRGKLLIAISTAGNSPAISKLVRQRLENIFDPNFGDRIEIVSKLRDEVKNVIDDPNTRVDFWRKFLNDKIFSPTAAPEDLEVSIRNALDMYRTQPQDRTD